MEQIDQIDYDLKQESRELKTINDNFLETKNETTTTINIIDKTIKKVKNQIKEFKIHNNQEIKDEFMLINEDALINAYNRINKLAEETKIDAEYIKELYSIVQKYWDQIDLENIISLGINQQNYYKNRYHSYEETGQIKREEASQKIIKALLNSTQVIIENSSNSIYQKVKNNTDITEIQKYSTINSSIPIDIDKYKFKSETISEDIYFDWTELQESKYITILSKINENVEKYVSGKTNQELWSKNTNWHISEKEVYGAQYNILSSNIIWNLQIWEAQQYSKKDWNIYSIIKIKFNIYTPIDE